MTMFIAWLMQYVATTTPLGEPIISAYDKSGARKFKLCVHVQIFSNNTMVFELFAVGQYPQCSQGPKDYVSFAPV